MENEIIDYDKVGISDSFMFGYIMEDTRRCKAFLEQILNIKIDHVEHVEREKDIKHSGYSHSVRLDIYTEDASTIYNCEMQVVNTYNIPKRSRYYQGQIDLKLLKPGEDYNKLKKSYVIFICQFDLFLENRCVYTFENRCLENLNLRLNDDSIKVFVNTKGFAGNVTDEFKELLHFLDTSEMKEYNNEFVNELARAVQDAREDKEWRHDYMTWTQYSNEIKEQARAEGEAAGVAKGRDSITILYEKLEKLNRLADYSKAMKDKEFLNVLLEEFNLK